MTLCKIEIALGYDVREKDLVNQPNVDRAVRVLGDLRESMADGDDDTPLEMLGMPSAICGYLYTGGVMSVEQLVGMSDSDLLQIDQIRAGRLDEIDRSLVRCGLSRQR